MNEQDLREINRTSVAFISSLRDEFSTNAKPIVLNGILGPKGDAYAPDALMIGGSYVLFNPAYRWLNQRGSEIENASEAEAEDKNVSP